MRKVGTPNRKEIKLSVIALAVSQAFICAPVKAAVINVDPPGTQGGCTLIEAINTANSDVLSFSCGQASGADTINLPANTTFSYFTGIAGGIVGNSALPTITSQIIINGNGSTIERTVSTEDFRVIEVENGDLRLRDTTVTGGYLTDDDGGGIGLRSSTIKLSRTTVSNNAANSGGGIFVDEGSTVSAYLFSKISDNYAANRGGGVRIRASAMNLYVASISGNKTYGAGGGIYAEDSSISLYGAAISGNSSTLSGGGVYAADSTFEVAQSTISSNSTNKSGGGVYFNESSLGVINSTISGNKAVVNPGGNAQDVKGGGLFIETGSTATILNSTFFDNVVVPNGPTFLLDSGGGLYAETGVAALTVNNTVIANSEPRDCGGLKPGVGLGNWFEDGSCAGVPNARGEPMLGPLESNGGPTKTHAPLPGSGLEGEGNGFVCQVAPVHNRDQRGQFRNDPCFVGAVDDIIDPTVFFTIPLPNGKVVVISL